jgi:type IV pilus assembly protein PilC
MPRFLYEAITETGAQAKGAIEADSIETAKNVLANRGFVPTKVTAERAGLSSKSLSGFSDMLTRVTSPDLILFTKQFRTLIKAGVPILTSLHVLESQTQNAHLKRIAASMSQDIKEGASLYDSFKAHPRTFSNLYCSMIRAGEASGSLPEVLSRLTYIIEHEYRIKSDIKSALRYPMMVVIALTSAFFVLLTFVIPKFATTFKSAGIELPLPTRMCIQMYWMLTTYWYVLLGVAGVVSIALALYLKTEGGQLARDALVLKLPIFGPLFLKTAMSRFASIFAILQASGVPILDSLRVLSGTIGNSAISRELDRTRDRVEEGRGIAAPLRSARYFTPIVVNMVAIGEESGNLDEMLQDVSTHYDDEVSYAIAGLSAALGPLLIVGLAGVVGFFALAIFLPMWDLTKMVHS